MKRKRKLQYYTVILVYENQDNFSERRSYFQTLAYSWKDAKKRAEQKAKKRYSVKYKLKKVEL